MLELMEQVLVRSVKNLSLQVQIEYLPVEQADLSVDFKHFALLYIK